MTNPRSVLLVGGPDAGKTNYLTRFWVALKAGEGCLRTRGLPADAEYLNSNEQALLGGAFAPHTPKSVHARNVIPVGWSKDGSGELVVPDCAGEAWEEIHRTREWSEEWEALLPSLAGCLVFVRAGSDEIVPALDWVNCAHLFGGPRQLSPTSAKARLPTQVLLVDWVQCLTSAFASLPVPACRLRIAMVVAAWDRVPKDQQAGSPADYIAANFRMLSDFILSNGTVFDVTHFGVSSTGGDLETEPGYRDEYLRDPTAAGYVVHSLGGTVARSSDLTLPVAWAMGVPVISAAAPGGGSRG